MNLITNDLQPAIKNQELARVIIHRPHRLGNYLGFKDLTDLHSEWIKYIWRSSGHVSLQAHRGSYKTTSVIIVGSIVNMTFNWNNRTAIIRKDFTSSSEVLKVISRLIKGERYQSLFYALFGVFPKLVMDSKGRLQWNLKTTETPEGNLNAFGIDSSLTGKHFDDILCDDIITLRDRISKAERASVDGIVREIMANIIDPGRFVKFTGSPWHKLDTWRLLPPPMVYDIYTTGLKAFTPEVIAEIKKITTASLFAANYELRHIASDDTIFDEPVYTNTWINGLLCQGHIDAKYQGSHTGALTIMSKRLDGKVQAIGFLFNKHIEQEYNFLMSKWRQYQCGTVHLELNADKGYSARDLTKMGMFTRSYNESENKHVKIVQNLKKHWQDIEWHKDTDPAYMAQILDYIEGQEPDDCADSAASCIRQSGFFQGESVVQVVQDNDSYKE